LDCDKVIISFIWSFEKPQKEKKKAMAILSFTFWHLLAFSKSTQYNLDFLIFFQTWILVVIDAIKL